MGAAYISPHRENERSGEEGPRERNACVCLQYMFLLLFRLSRIGIFSDFLGLDVGDSCTDCVIATEDRYMCVCGLCHTIDTKHIQYGTE